MRRERQGWFGIKRGNVEDQNAIGWNLSVHLLRSSAKDPPAFRTPLPVSFSPVEHLYYTRRRHARHDCRADSLSLVVYLLFAELLFFFEFVLGQRWRNNCCAWCASLFSSSSAPFRWPFRMLPQVRTIFIGVIFIWPASHELLPTQLLVAALISHQHLLARLYIQHSTEHMFVRTSPPCAGNKWRSSDAPFDGSSLLAVLSR